MSYGWVHQESTSGEWSQTNFVIPINGRDDTQGGFQRSESLRDPPCDVKENAASPKRRVRPVSHHGFERIDHPRGFLCDVSEDAAGSKCRVRPASLRIWRTSTRSSRPIGIDTYPSTPLPVFLLPLQFHRCPLMARYEHRSKSQVLETLTSSIVSSLIVTQHSTMTML